MQWLMSLGQFKAVVRQSLVKGFGIWMKQILSLTAEIISI